MTNKDMDAMPLLAPKILNPKRKILDERLLRLVWLVAGKPGEEWADGPIRVPDGGGLPELAEAVARGLGDRLEFNPAVAEALQIIETLDIEMCASRPEAAVERKFHIELVLTGGTKAVCLKALCREDAETKAVMSVVEQINALGFQDVGVETVSVEEGR